MGINIPERITPEWLREHPEYVFVFGDNLQRWGKGGAAICRDEPNAYGFITKKAPNNRDESFFRPDEEYLKIAYDEIVKLSIYIVNNPDKTFLVSRLGAGLANKYGIYETILVRLLNALKNSKIVGKRIVLLS